MFFTFITIIIFILHISVILDKTGNKYGKFRPLQITKAPIILNFCLKSKATVNCTTLCLTYSVPLFKLYTT